MTKDEWKQDLVIVLFIIAPFAMLAVQWHNISALIPVPWSTKSGRRDLVSKSILLVTCLLPLASYLILLIPQLLPIPWIRKIISGIGEKYYNIKVATSIFMMFLSWLIIWQNQINQYMLDKL